MLNVTITNGIMDLTGTGLNASVSNGILTLSGPGLDASIESGPLGQPNGSGILRLSQPINPRKWCHPYGNISDYITMTGDTGSVYWPMIARLYGGGESGYVLNDLEFFTYHFLNGSSTTEPCWFTDTPVDEWWLFEKPKKLLLSISFINYAYPPDPEPDDVLDIIVSCINKFGQNRQYYNIVHYRGIGGGFSRNWLIDLPPYVDFDMGNPPPEVYPYPYWNDPVYFPWPGRISVEITAYRDSFRYLAAMDQAEIRLQFST